MSHTRRSRYSSRSASPYQQSRSFSRSLSRTPSRSRSWSRGCDSPDAVNHGNNLYVTGLSSNVSKAELRNHFGREGKVVDVHLVVDPYSRESRGFGFVTMGRIEEAERCMKYLDGSILDGRVITVEKRAKRGRGRTPTPGRYLGLRRIPPHRRSPSRSPYRSRRRLSNSDRERSYSPYYYSRSPSPYRRRRRYNRSPNRRRSSLESRSPSRSTSPYYSSRSPSPRLRRSSRRSYSRSFSPAVTVRRRYRRRSISPRRSYRRRRYSSSVSPRRHHRRTTPSHTTVSNKKRYSRESYSHSRSFSSHSTTVSSSSNRST